MKRDQIFCLVLTVVVSAVFLAAVALTFQPSHTTIIMGAAVEPDFGGGMDSAVSEHVSSARPGGRGSSDEEDAAEESGLLSDQLSMPVPPVWELPEDWWPELPAGEEEPSSDPAPDPGSGADSSPEPSQETPPPDFSAAEELARRIEAAYSLTVTLSTTDHPVDPERCFVSGEAALAAVESLQDVCAAFGELFPALARQGYRVQIVLSSAGDTDLAIFRSGQELLFQLTAGGGDWRFSFACAVTGAIEDILLETAGSDALYPPFTACNPGSFQYGAPDFSLIRGSVDSTCFLDVTCQRSVGDDRTRLYAYAALDMIPAAYRKADCPLWQKLQVMESQYRQYLFS